MIENIENISIVHFVIYTKYTIRSGNDHIILSPVSSEGKTVRPVWNFDWS
jgi:hypothetical protein